MDLQHVEHTAELATTVPAFVMNIVWTIFAAGLLGVCAWIGRTLYRLGRGLETLIDLCRWLKKEHQKTDSPFATERLMPLLDMFEELIRHMKATRKTMRWLAHKMAKEEPPPSDDGED